MGIIDKYKEQREKDKEEFFEKLEEAKEYTKESFSKEHREKVLQENIEIHNNEEFKKLNDNQYTTHMKLFLGAIPAFIIGLIFPPIMLVTIGLILAGLICMVTHWKQINGEYKKRTQIKNNIRNDINNRNNDN